MSDRSAREERRGRTSSQITHLFEERRELLALLVKASTLDPAKPGPQERELLAEFCEVMVDYVAAGHFGLYNRIADGNERRKTVANLASYYFPRISDTTQAVVAFNEKYAPDGRQPDLQSLHADLSTLSELLTTRMDLEDQLIERLLEGARSQRSD